MQDEGQQVADELAEVEEFVEDELDAGQETETDAEPAAEGGVDEVVDEAAADDFQVCAFGHQPESEPGPGPGPSLGPFCSDILSWVPCCKLVVRLATSRSSQKRTASLRRALLSSPLRIIGELRLVMHDRRRFHACSVLEKEKRMWFLCVYANLSLLTILIAISLALRKNHQTNYCSFYLNTHY